MNNLYLHSFKSKLGTIRTAATDKGLALISLPGETSDSFEGNVQRLFGNYQILPACEYNKEAEKQLKAFFAGKLKNFKLKLDIKASPFHKKALKRVSRIPYGQVMSYGEIAAAIGSPRAARAVGTANAKNNLPIVIPCHRVVASNGIGGYGGGLETKRKLLEMEGVKYER